MTESTAHAPDRARRARLSISEMAVEGLGLAGAAAVLYGVAQIYPPAAWILGGLAAIGVAIALGAGVLRFGED
jgi:uncharacterized membrane protein